MPHYRYARSLDGAPEGTVRQLDTAEAAPLLKSGAIEETGAPATTTPAPADASGDKTLTSATVGETKQAVAAPAAAKPARPSR